jgi:hypothetical protein
MKKYLIIALMILVVSVFFKETPPVIKNGTSASSTPVIYKNERLGFTLTHPRSLSVQEIEEGGGAFTLAFESLEEQKGFQIFVLPYKESKISDDRFRRDVPSGIRKNWVPGVVGGTEAVFFESQNAVLGETREVWFIKNGYLYEITTPKELETWLYSILETWRF